MPGGFKVASAYVAVNPDDTGFEDRLREQIKAAADRIDAKVGLRLGDDAVISLHEDVLAAVDLATEKVKAEVGLGLKGDAAEALDAEVKAGVDAAQQDAKVKVKVDEKAARDTQQGLSGLIVAGIAGGAAIGAPALLTAVSAALDAITVKALENNQVISADFSRVAADAQASLSQAVSPLAPEVHAALSQLDTEIGKLQPDLDSLFANANPDIQSFVAGVDGLVSGALPGLSKALGDSHDLVADVAASMGTLGQGVGSFFTGLTRDASTTGQGLAAVVGTASTALGTLGNIAGSASAAVSADLLAITPAVNVALTAIDKLSNPATVGAAGGAFAAWKLGGPIQKGLQGISDGMLKVAARTEGAGGMLGRLSGAAEGSSLGLSKMADVMGGPWGIAIGAGVGLLSGLAGELINAGNATKAVTVNAQDLQNAVAQDGGAAGQATAAYITASTAANGLSSSFSAAGVSQTTLTQAILGNKAAQDEATAAIEKLNQKQAAQAASAQEASGATNRAAVEMHGADTMAAQYAASTNQLSDANQKALNSLNAETAQVADAIAKQTQYQQAVDAVTNSEDLFDASLQAVQNQLTAQAKAAALTTVGSLDLGSANYGVNASLAALVTGYSEAQSGGNAYAQVLAALDGQTQSLLGSEAAFTTALNGVSAAAKANGHSLDVNTKSGAANITAFTGIATAADKAATAVYDSEVNSKGAAQAYDDANKKLAQEKQAFEDAAIKAGFNKDQVKALADELFQLPPDVSVGVDPSGALVGLDKLLKTIDTSHGTVKIYEDPSGYVRSTGGTMKAHALGGPSQAGVPEIVGDGGRPEVFVPKTDGYVYPSVDAGMQAIAAHNAKVTGPAAGHAVTVNQYFSGSQHPGSELRAQMSHELATVLGGL